MVGILSPTFRAKMPAHWSCTATDSFEYHVLSWNEAKIAKMTAAQWSEWSVFQLSYGERAPDYLVQP